MAAEAVGGPCHHDSMRCSVTIPNFGDFANPQVVAEFARVAEQCGWDGLFVWDHVLEEKRRERPIADPWVLLTAAAMATARIRLGTAVTPVARRRPQKLAREVTTLDRLTGGRMILGVGLGTPVDDEYGSFGEPTDPRVLAERLDEGLAVLDLLWSGEQVNYRGNHLTVNDVRFRPTPVQRPRVPIWVGGFWPNRAPMRRAARWDGAIPVTAGLFDAAPPSVDEVREMRTFLRRIRADAGLADEPFELVLGGRSPVDARDLLGPLVDAGMTWWDERMPFDDTLLDRLDPIRRRIEQGPPRL